MISDILENVLKYSFLLLIGDGMVGASIWLIWNGIKELFKCKEFDEENIFDVVGIIVGNIGCLICAIVFFKVIGM